MRPESLLEPLLDRALGDPRRLAISFVEEDGTERAILAHEVRAAMGAWAGRLAAAGVGRGETVLIVLRHSFDLIGAFWGTLYCGAVPCIFPYLTEKLDPAIYRAQVSALVRPSAARAVITSAAFRAELERVVPEGCRILAVDEVDPTDSGSPFAPPSRLPGGDERASLIYSSGTTGLQKGIVHSHRTVLESLARLRDRLEVKPRSVIVSWLPLFHDMGLITGLLLPAFCGVPVVLQSPFSWVRSPKTLFSAVHRHRATHCWMPNFAFNHSVRSVRDRDLEGIDLSSWRVLLNSSEPVRLESLESFAARFSARGFRRSALGTGYGMTEVSGAVTLSRPGEFPPVDWVDRGALQLEARAVPALPAAVGSIALVSSGTAVEGIDSAILDAEERRLEDRRVGEIAVRSDFCRDGYHQRPDLNATTIRGGWFLTGDLGYTVDGQLFVCGRKKDLILTGGKNLYPEDLEEIANQVSGVYPGRAVAFGIDDPQLGTEAVAMVCELREPLDEASRFEVERELRRKVVGTMGITLADVRLVADRGWVIKTSNGKIARAANREKYLRG